MPRSGPLVISVLSTGPGEPLRQLHDELRRAGFTVTPATAPVPGGGKSTVGTVTSLAVSGLLSAAGLRAAGQILLAVVRRGEKRRIEIRHGDDVFILEGTATRDGDAALNAWLHGLASADDADDA